MKSICLLNNAHKCVKDCWYYWHSESTIYAKNKIKDYDMIFTRKYNLSVSKNFETDSQEKCTCTYVTQKNKIFIFKMQPI